MIIKNNPFLGCFVIQLDRKLDRRGSFLKEFNYSHFLNLGIDFEIKEVFSSISNKNVIRGMHFQVPLKDNHKIIYCFKGSLNDVLIDLRPNSSTYLKTFNIKLSSDDDLMIIIPRGIAHGFLSLEDNTEILYLTSSEYSIDHDSGIRYNSFSFDWNCENPIVSDRDKNLANLKDFCKNNPFDYSKRSIIMSKRAIITGVSGFIGSKLAESLLESDWKICITKREKSNLDFRLLSHPNVEIIDYTGYESLEKTFKDFKPEIVFHVASKTFYDYDSNEIGSIIDSNLTFGTHLLECMWKTGVRHFVNTGTSWQHFNNAKYEPVNLYAATKESFDKIIEYYSVAHGIQSITLKLYDTFGHGDNRKKLLSLLFEHSRSKEPLNLSPGEQHMMYLSVDDVIKGYLSALYIFNKNDGGFNLSYALTSNQIYTIREIVELFNKYSVKKVEVNFGKKAYRLREVMNPWHTLNVLPNWDADTSNLDEFIKSSCDVLNLEHE